MPELVAPVSKGDKWVKRTFIALQLYCLVSLFYSLQQHNRDNIKLSLLGFVLLFSPWLVERLFGIKLSAVLKMMFMFFSLGSMTGHVYNAYYIFPKWDKILHTTCGVLAAAVGYGAVGALDRENCGRHSRQLCVFVAVCFSLFVASVWEFFEFGLDMLFGMDMQNDRIISGFSSYLLGAEMGMMERISGITSVVIDGVDLQLGGYLDIGLIDTMLDMIVCTIGAIGYCYVVCHDKWVEDWPWLIPQPYDHPALWRRRAA